MPGVLARVAATQLPTLADFATLPPDTLGARNILAFVQPENPDSPETTRPSRTAAV